MLCRMADGPERSHDVRFGFPILRFHFLAEVLIERCRTCAVEKHEDFEFLFHAISLVLSFRALRRCSGQAKSRMERLGKPRHRREGHRLSERELSESNLS